MKRFLIFALSFLIFSSCMTLKDETIGTYQFISEENILYSGRVDGSLILEKGSLTDSPFYDGTVNDNWLIGNYPLLAEADAMTDSFAMKIKSTLTPTLTDEYFYHILLLSRISEVSTNNENTLDILSAFTDKIGGSEISFLLTLQGQNVKGGNPSYLFIPDVFRAGDTGYTTTIEFQKNTVKKTDLRITSKPSGSEILTTTYCTNFLYDQETGVFPFGKPYATVIITMEDSFDWFSGKLTKKTGTYSVSFYRSEEAVFTRLTIDADFKFKLKS